MSRGFISGHFGFLFELFGGFGNLNLDHEIHQQTKNPTRKRKSSHVLEPIHSKMETSVIYIILEITQYLTFKIFRIINHPISTSGSQSIIHGTYIRLYLRLNCRNMLLSKTFIVSGTKSDKTIDNASF